MKVWLGGSDASGSSSAGRTSDITDQVAAQIGRQLLGARTLRDGTHHTVLRLSPEHLGDVTITLDVRAGGVRLDLAAGSVALAALQADLGQLRDDLAGSGLDLGDVTLSSADAGGTGTNGQPRDPRPDPTPRGPAGPGGGFGSSAGTPGEPAAPPRPGRKRSGGLDVLA